MFILLSKAMANATTANLPPINGLYVAFFSVVAYLIFGTSKHLSLGIYSILYSLKTISNREESYTHTHIQFTKGTHGVISIMVGNLVKSYEGILYAAPNEHHNGTITNPNYLSDNPDEAKIMLAMTLAIFAGSLQVCLLCIRE